MGVDYSAHVGYGVAVESDSCSYEEEVAEWLEASGYEHVEFAVGGNWMNGEYVTLFHIPGTFTRIDYRYSNGQVMSFDTPEITPEQTDELKRLCVELNIDFSSIGWKLVFNVS